MYAKKPELSNNKAKEGAPSKSGNIFGRSANKKNVVAKSPFFYRLIDERPGDKNDEEFNLSLTLEGLKQSIAQEISLILNTRLTVRQRDYNDMADSKLNFGLPSLFGMRDFQSLELGGCASWHKISKICQNAIASFEPRMKNVKVKVESFNRNKQTMRVSVIGEIVYGPIKEQARFPLTIGLN